MDNLLFCILMAVYLSSGTNGFSDNNLGPGQKVMSKEEIIEKSHMLRQVSTSRCLVIENPVRPSDSGERVVLWDCHDRLTNEMESEMFVLVKSNGGGYLIMGSAGSANKCVFAGKDYYDPLMTGKCDPDNANQSWLFRRVDGTHDKMQMVQRSTGRCLRAPGNHNGAWLRVGDCNHDDSEQIWRVCKYDGTCNF